MQVRVASEDDSPCVDWTLDVTPGATVRDLVDALERSGCGPIGIDRVGGAVIDGTWCPAATRLDAAPLANGSEIRFATAEPRGRPGRSGASGMALVAVAGPDTGRRLVLSAPTTVIGRGADTASVRDPAMSRRHLRVAVAPTGGVVVDDVGSTNGTWVDGRSAAHPLAARCGTEIRAGATVLRLEQAPATATRPNAAPSPHHRPPRVAARPAPEPLTPPVTPSEPERPRLGVATLAVPLATGAVLTMIYGPRLAVLVVIGPLIALVGWLVARHGADRAARRASREHHAALDALARSARAAQQSEVDRRRAAFPGLLDALTRAADLDHRVWERRRHHDDFLHLVAGSGDEEWTCPTTSTPDAAAATSLASIGPLRGVPITVDATGLVGIVGPRPLAVSVARALAVQAVVLHGPADIRLRVLTTSRAATDWLWARWLPHAVDGDGHERLIATDCAAANAAASARGADDDGPLDWWIVDGDDEALARTGAIRALVTDRASPASGLVIAEHRHDLPATCATVLEVDAHGACAVERLDGLKTAVVARFAGCQVSTAEAAARQLARRTDPEVSAGTGDLPDTCALLPILGLAEADEMAQMLRRRWSRTAGTDELVLPVGADRNGAVEIDLVRDGPHALIAGTTGSGKSELLRSLVASIAASADTEHVSLVLVDFKGGAAFDRLAELPHVVGSVTDLDDRLAARALRCLDAELRRREEQLRAAGASDIGAYVRSRRLSPELAPLPRLVVVVDEFATLAAELPDFVDSLVDLAQRGRSLGVHLVLATQRPAGAVKDSIRTNTNLRIALRVVEAADSRDVLGSDVAARLPLRRPGRAAMRSGSNAITTFQAAQISGLRSDQRREPVRAERWVVPRSSVRTHGAGASADEGTGHDDLDRLIAAVTEAHAAGGHELARRPWPDPLPADVDAARLGDARAFALLDDPDHQRQIPLRWEPSSGNLVIAGLPGSGVTTAMDALARSLVHDTEPDARHLYVVTTDAPTLAPLASLPHCGAVIPTDDIERVVRLMHRLDAELRARRRDRDALSPAVVILIDGVTSLRAELDERGLLDELDLLERLAAEGPAVGLTFIFGGEHPGAIGHRIERTAVQRVLLRLPERADYTQAGLHGIEPHDLPPGRGFLATGGEIQIVRPSLDHTEPAGCGSGRALIGRARPWTVEGLPRQAALDERFTATALPDGTLHLPIGVGGVSGGQVTLTLRPGDHALVAGPARSGKSTTISTMASLLASVASVRVVRVDGRGIPRLTGADIRDLVLDALADDLITVALVDDADLVDDSGGALLALMQASDVRLHVVAAGRGDRLRSLFRHWTNEVRRSRLGLLLRGDEIDGDLLGGGLPRRPAAPWVAGRGWLVHDDGIALCQVASQPTLPDDDNGLAEPIRPANATMEDDECA